MPRPYVDRVPLSIRLPREVHEELVKKAERRGLSLNETIELAVRRLDGRRKA